MVNYWLIFGLINKKSNTTSYSGYNLGSTEYTEAPTDNADNGLGEGIDRMILLTASVFEQPAIENLNILIHKIVGITYEFMTFCIMFDRISKCAQCPKCAFCNWRVKDNELSLKKFE